MLTSHTLLFAAHRTYIIPAYGLGIGGTKQQECWHFGANWGMTLQPVEPGSTSSQYVAVSSAKDPSIQAGTTWEGGFNEGPPFTAQTSRTCQDACNRNYACYGW